MTRSTQQFILSLVMFVASLGVMGYLIWKVGILDILVYMVINTAVLFLMMFVVLGVMNPDTYNMFMDNINSFYHTLVEKVFGEKA